MVKNCVVCGKEFEPIPPQRKTCSKACSESRHSQKVDEYNLMYYEEIKLRRRKRARAKAKPIYCKICGEVVERILYNGRIIARKHHEQCVINEAIQAIKEKKSYRKDSRIIRAWNTFGYTVSELKEIMQDEEV